MTKKKPQPKIELPLKHAPAPIEDRSILCKQCGELCDSTHLFCSACGCSLAEKKAPPPAPIECEEPEDEASEREDAALPAILEPEKPPLTPAPQPCRRCETQLPHDAKFCLECGTPTGGEARPVIVHVGSDGEVKAAQPVDGKVVIGKDPRCEIVIPADQYLSRRHSCVVSDSTGLWLEDLGSSNGTYLRIGRAIMLEAGDEFMAGSSMFRVEMSS
jgi:hypothetical protein